MPRTANDQILDAEVHHNVDLQRYSKGLVTRIIGVLNRADADLVQQLERTAPEKRDTWTFKRKQRLLDGLRRINRNAYSMTGKALTKELLGLAPQEAAFAARTIQNAVPIELDMILPTRELLRSVVESQPFRGKIMKEWFTELEQGRFRRMKDAINIGIVEGETVDQMVRRLVGSRANNFRDGILDISRRDATTVVRTAVNHVTTRAKETTYQENDDLIKGVQWLSTLDSHTTPICRTRDGKVFEPGEGPRPPAHPNCLPGTTLVAASSRITKGYQRWYDGELIVISTAAGNNLSCTPNHPILTDIGWLPAKLIDTNRKVFRDFTRQWKPATAAVDHQNNHIPAAIQEITESLLTSQQMATVKVPAAAEYFHGDGEGGEITVVAPDGLLRRQVSNTKRTKHLFDTDFIFRTMRAVALFTQRAMFQLFCGGLRAATGSLGLLSDLGPLILGRNTHPNGLLLTTVPQSDPALDQQSLNRTWTDAEDVRNPANATALGIELCDVVTVQRRDFRGHVFNLETEKGTYFAGGILTHNCRSTTVPVVKSWEELGVDLEEAPDGTRASMDGQVPADETYGDWLKRQQRDTVEEILGKKKASLYIDGKLPIDRFTDETGREFTLAELSSREKTAWDRAFGSAAAQTKRAEETRQRLLDPREDLTAEQARSLRALKATRTGIINKIARASDDALKAELEDKLADVDARIAPLVKEPPQADLLSGPKAPGAAQAARERENFPPVQQSLTAPGRGLDPDDAGWRPSENMAALGQNVRTATLLDHAEYGGIYNETDDDLIEGMLVTNGKTHSVLIPQSLYHKAADLGFKGEGGAGKRVITFHTHPIDEYSLRDGFPFSMPPSRADYNDLMNFNKFIDREVVFGADGSLFVMDYVGKSKLHPGLTIDAAIGKISMDQSFAFTVKNPYSDPTGGFVVQHAMHVAMARVGVTRYSYQLTGVQKDILTQLKPQLDHWVDFFEQSIVAKKPKTLDQFWKNGPRAKTTKLAVDRYAAARIAKDANKSKKLKRFVNQGVKSGLLDKSALD